jgi:NAD(P)H-quinone oxidoreductase subunit 5
MVGRDARCAVNTVLAVSAALPLVGGVLGWLLPRAAAPAGGALGHRCGALAAGLGLLGAVLLTAQVVTSGTAVVGLTDARGRLVLGWATDRVAVVLLVLVLGVGTVVQAFARRYLSGDPRAGWFALCAGLVTSASAGLVTAATLVTLAACWTAAGIGLCGVLATYSHLPAARAGVARTARTFLVGDLALWAAVVVATRTWGPVDLRGLGAAQLQGHPVVLGAVLCGVVVAAVTRSAQVPAHRWLPATLAAPTPASALLHAGVVNAGGILLVKLGGPLAAVPVAGGLAFAAGAVTALWGTVLMLTKPDVKGALAHSTMGQMGFMVMAAGLGLHALVVFHLVAHGMYKATLFLSSGTAIHQHRARAAAPGVRDAGTRPAPPFGVLAAVLLAPAAALAAGVVLLPGTAGHDAASEVLLVFAWASAAAAGWAGVHRYRSPAGVALSCVAAGGAALAYLAWVRTVTQFLAPALPAVDPLVGAPWLLLVVALALALTTVLWQRPPGGAVAALRDGLYVAALRAGHVHTRQRATGPDPLASTRFLTTPIGART